MEWEKRVSDLWESIDDYSGEEFLTRMEQLVAELPADSAAAVFERASSFDSTGHSDLAVCPCIDRHSNSDYMANADVEP